MEDVDIVNINCEVVSKTSKEEAHKRGLLHKTVIAEIMNSTGKWALVKQNSTKQDPGQYVSPVGGHVKAGESDEDALKREALEEAGIKGFEYKIKGRFIFDRFVNNHQENHYFIIYEILCDQDIILNEESVSYKRFSKEELKQSLKNNLHSFGKAFVVIIEKLYPELL